MKTAKQKERELIIKLHNEKKSCRDIAFILGIGKSTASYWISRYKKTKSLENKPRSGRPTKVTKHILNKIYDELLENAESKNKAGISSKEVLNALKEKTGNNYSLRHAQRILHRIGFSLITPRVHHKRKDEKAQDKFRSEFKKNSNRNIWVVQS